MTRSTSDDDRLRESFVAFVESLEVADHTAPLRPIDRGPARPWWVVAAVAAVVALLVGVSFLGIPRLARTEEPASPTQGEPALPDQIAAYSWLTASDDSPGPALIGFQYGFNVEFMDFEQYVVLSADGSRYRRVPAVESRNITTGDMPLALLSPDGSRLAVGSDDRLRDLLLLDLTTGETHTIALDAPAGVFPIAWDDEGRAVWVVAAQSMNTWSMESRGRVLRIDLDDGTTSTLPAGDAVPARKVAVSPNGRYVATGGEVRSRVWEAASGRRVAVWDFPVLTGGWSPDGSLVVGHGPGRKSWRVARVAGSRVSGISDYPARDWVPNTLSWVGDDELLMIGDHGSGENPARLDVLQASTGQVVSEIPVHSEWRGAGVGGLTVASELGAAAPRGVRVDPDRGRARTVMPWLIAGGAIALGWAVWVRRRRLLG